jgi:very-short-patch-repair endonuclease
VPVEITADERLAAKRLDGLLDYVEALVKLDERPAARLAQHRLADGSQFILHQHELAGLPGLSLDGSDSDGPIWLRIERLQRTAPPQPEERCSPWIEVSNDPAKPPAIKDVLHRRVTEGEKDKLLNAGVVRPEDVAPALKGATKDEPPGAYFDVMLRVEDRAELRTVLEDYCTTVWIPWAEIEKPRRRSIAVYQRLFEIAQRLLQSGGQESAELIWGLGLARWTRPEEVIDLPLLERQVEIEIADQKGAAITIRPRAIGAQIDLRAFEKLALDRLAPAEDTAKRSLRTIETADSEGVSPFRPETYEPVLKTCGSRLDPDGRYLPETLTLPASEPVPAAEGRNLTVSDRYVLFARRRSANSVLRDIERFKAKLASDEVDPVVLDGAARTLVMGPGDEIDDAFEPISDAIEAGDAGSLPVEEPIDPDQGDLFFPKAFNDDQVEIIRRLEKSEGLVVQGPPGTGKTHTIANIICHMLATGRRVLVVSHGETALRVIRDQLPEGVRDLTISITTSEREGLKQVEKAIGLMLSIVNTIGANPQRQRSVIMQLQAEIVRCRKLLADIDAKIASIATAHLSHMPGAAETPYQAAQRIVADRPRFEWFTDRPASFADTELDEQQINACSQARIRVGNDLAYLNETLPNPADLPAPSTLMEWHRDLVVAASLSGAVAISEPLLRRTVAQIGADEAEKLASDLKSLADAVGILMQDGWAWSLVERHQSEAASFARVRPAAIAFLSEATELVASRAHFLAKPVSLPQGLPSRAECEQILQVYRSGKNPFGVFAFRLKAYQPLFAQIRLSGLPPATAADWTHVTAYMLMLDKVTSLAARWTTLRVELAIPAEVDFDSERVSPLDMIADRLQQALITVPSTFTSLSERLERALGSQAEARSILHHHSSTAAFGDELMRYLAALRLGVVRARVEETGMAFTTSSCSLATNALQILNSVVGNAKSDAAQLQRVWDALLGKLRQLRGLDASFGEIASTCEMLAQGGAPAWSECLRYVPAAANLDPVVPSDWKEAWTWASNLAHLEAIGASSELTALHRERLSTETELRDLFAKLVKERTFFQLARSMKGSAMSALRSFADIIRRLAGGRGQRAVLYRQDSRRAMESCYDAVPCWIMPTWRVSEQLPTSFGAFDLVILDEASQSDARELPALLRGKKILVVGDDRQVSPSAAFLSIARIGRLRDNFLSEFPYRAQVEPGASLYDLSRVMFPNRFVMLKEHFRCVEPIIRFSMQFYNEPLIPLRIPRGVERLDPPLIDIYVEDGERRGKSKVNPAEAEVIVAEIEKIIADPILSVVGGDKDQPRSIGVISLVGAEQAAFVQKELMERIGEAAMVRHRIMCGDSATFQGDERHIIFLSMIADKKRKQAQTATQYEQRFNVALSRARDRLILVRSVTENDLTPTDLKARVLAHFKSPMPERQATGSALVDLCESSFERDVFSALIKCGYHVTPQVGAEGFSIDMVVEGEGGRRLAVECDGDRYHGPEKWADDMRRQRVLERVGWTFWRCFGSNWSLNRSAVFDDLLQTLERSGIRPMGATAAPAQYTEHRSTRGFSEEGYAGDEAGASVISIGRSGHGQPPAFSTTDNQLSSGDRVVLRFLDDPQSHPVCYILTERSDDRLNGYLSLSSPLAKALAEASPGDEIIAHDGKSDRPILFVSLEPEVRQVA